MQAHSSATVRIREPIPRNDHDMDDSMLEGEPLPSTSAETIRQLPLHISLPAEPAHASKPGTSSQPSSPHSELPSPSSPSGDSVSSFPSVSSSFLFSSGPGSPPHLGQPPEHDSELEHGDSSLIIPSLTLPSPVRRPTPFGQSLGEVRLLVLGRKNHGADIIEVFTDMECEDIVDVGQWETYHTANGLPSARCLRVSTDWNEHKDAHGLERHEPSRNVELVHLPEYDDDDNVRPSLTVSCCSLTDVRSCQAADIVRNTLECVHSAFRSVHAMVHPDQPPSDPLANLLSSSTTPLYTALVLATSQREFHDTRLLRMSLSSFWDGYLRISASCHLMCLHAGYNPVLTYHFLASLPLEHTLIAELSTHIPLIILPPLGAANSIPLDTHGRRRSSRYPHPDATLARSTLGKARLSSLQPTSADTLRTIIFRQPEALTSLRLEAVDRFLRWREVERAVDRLMRSPDNGTVASSQATTTQNLRDDPATTPTKLKWGGGARWDKARWEAEWEGALAVDVAKTLRTRRRTERARPAPPDYFSPMTPVVAAPLGQQPSLDDDTLARERKASQAPQARLPPFDPLHIPSLLAFSLSLLAPLRARIAEALGLRSRGDVLAELADKEFDAGARSEHHVHFSEIGDDVGLVGRGGIGVGGWALVGAFCTGVGVGIVLTRI